jgi:hypothetical protein
MNKNDHLQAIEHKIVSLVNKMKKFNRSENNTYKQRLLNLINSFFTRYDLLNETIIRDHLKYYNFMFDTNVKFSKKMLSPHKKLLHFLVEVIAAKKKINDTTLRQVTGFINVPLFESPVELGVYRHKISGDIKKVIALHTILICNHKTNFTDTKNLIDDETFQGWCAELSGFVNELIKTKIVEDNESKRETAFAELWLNEKDSNLLIFSDTYIKHIIRIANKKPNIKVKFSNELCKYYELLIKYFINHICKRKRIRGQDIANKLEIFMIGYNNQQINKIYTN